MINSTCQSINYLWLERLDMVKMSIFPYLPMYSIKSKSKSLQFCSLFFVFLHKVTSGFYKVYGPRIGKRF